MDLGFHETCQDDDERIEAGELLEDCWFFGNLLQRKSRMLRSYSDPCSSSNYNQELNFPGKSYEETYDSINKLPSTLQKQELTPESDHLGRGRSIRKAPSINGLVRAPSLPTTLESAEDDEVEFSMGKLIRQASLNHSDSLPPRKHAAKGVKGSSSISRTKSTRKAEVESIKFEGFKDAITPQRPMNNQLKTQKSMKDLESEELQGFRDLGFDFDEKDLSPNVVSIIPGLQEKNRIEEEEESRTSRPYLSEAWAAQSSAPPVPRWGGKRSTEDVKAQIKFWARAVASNVRQEC